MQLDSTNFQRQMLRAARYRQAFEKMAHDAADGGLLDDGYLDDEQGRTWFHLRWHRILDGFAGEETADKLLVRSAAVEFSGGIGLIDGMNEELLMLKATHAPVLIAESRELFADGLWFAEPTSREPLLSKVYKPTRLKTRRKQETTFVPDAISTQDLAAFLPR